MTRTKRIAISGIFLGLCAILIGHSYWHHYVIGLADAAFTLQRNDQYEEAIAKADEAIKHSGDALGYYVRGASRLKLMGRQQMFTPAELEKSKADLTKAAELTDKEEMKKECARFLEVVDQWMQLLSEG